MSMVLFASVVRVGDGLPLSASTDYEQDRELQETKRHLKGLSKKLGQFPDRCTLKTGPYNVNFTSALGVGYLMVCTANYPNVLAFCFLDELQKEFIITYDPKRISSAVRPYSFIEFDTFIQKTKQRYNSPRSLSTKINLADMQTEIKLRPPYQLSPEDLRAINGFSVHTPSKYKGIAPTQMLEPVTLSGIVSCVLSILCGGLNLLRGVHAIESILQNDDEDFNYVIAFFLGTAACLYQTLHHRDDIMKVLGCRNKNQTSCC
ncbi:vesicle-trafficking protein SEC22a isoform X3 [Epinephelus fuscoguttatus]|uniref:vesicle-trafficking protein SEC22a isoform X3 n=1 Tax=Epinephelus fuscoguttatus TaxID=293821 RepID=UPI0020D1A2C5|nr:vesicle-trafficking protein SEC22a isoform X3 [Epinephelus fuscoguttatus]